MNPHAYQVWQFVIGTQGHLLLRMQDILVVNLLLDGGDNLHLRLKRVQDISALKAILKVILKIGLKVSLDFVLLNLIFQDVLLL